MSTSFLRVAGALVAFVLLGVVPARADMTISGIGHTLCMTVYNNKLQVNHCNGSDGQNWFTNAYGAQHYHGLCLDSASPSRGAQLVVVSCANKPSQRWALSTNGRFNNESGWCADVQGGHPAEGTPVIIYTCTGQSNQVWGRGVMTPVSSLGVPTALLAQKTAGSLFTVRGSSLISQDGGSLIGQDGNGIITQDGASVIRLNGGAMLGNH